MYADPPIITVNRTAIVVKPAQPFLEWLHGIDPDNQDLTLEEIRDEPNIYLLTQCDACDEIRRRLRKVFGEIFEEELNS